MAERKIKVLWVSDGVVPTGFSRVAHSLISRFPKEKYEIVMLGINYWGDPHDYPFKIYPAGISHTGDIYGLGKLSIIIKKEKPDIVFILNDIWIIKRYLKEIKELLTEKEAPPKPKVVVYFPVDGLRHDPEWYEEMDIVDRTVVYTEFGKEVASTAAPDIKYDIIPHGLDTEVFFKVAPTRREVRDKYFVEIPNREVLVDSFMVLNANRNQPRKKPDITIEAFSMFAKDKPANVHLYLHMGIKDSYIDLIKFIKYYNLEDRILFTSKKIGAQMVSDKKLNMIYNICDVGLNTGIGEGWGLVNMEHAVTGAPQIVGNHTVNYEFYNDCGLLVEPVAHVTTEFATQGSLIRPEDVAKKLELLYNDRELLDELGRKSVAKFTSPAFSWGTVAGMWDKLFTEVMDGNNISK